MFERYTEKARRVVFFARYEASVFGSPCIETEHLMLGVLREDKALANRFLPGGLAVESIRKQVEQRTTPREKTSTSVDLPLSHESKRVLTFAAEESERLNHRLIGTVHLLLGLLREEGSLAASVLREQGLRLGPVRDAVARDKSAFMDETSGGAGGLPAKEPETGVAQKAHEQWLVHAKGRIASALGKRQQQGGITVARRPKVASSEPDLAVFAGAGVYFEGEFLEEKGPGAAEAAALAKKIELVVQHMENAIANHDFDKARLYSEEERTMRDELRRKRAEHNPTGALAAPFLCIEFITEWDSLAALQKRIQEYFAAGVRTLWLFARHRTYTATPEAGLREFTGTVLRTESPTLELSLEELPRE